MPPVMGAAAFVMASFIGVTYFEVVKHAFLLAIISYIALFYISHLEALKVGLKGMEEKDVPNLKKTFFSWITFFNSNICSDIFASLFKAYSILFYILCYNYINTCKFNK